MSDPDSYIPDYEQYDYQGEWRERSIEDLTEKRLITKWIIPSECCLELGGSYGRITMALEPHFKKVFMIDYSRKNLSTASMRLTRTVLVRGDIRRIPFDDACFDCIVIVRVLHHVRRIARVLDEIVRVGRNDCTVILGVPNTGLGKYRGIKVNQKVLIGPQKHMAFIHPLGAYCHPMLELIERRGGGMFDNSIGSKLNRFWALSNLDVATSFLWPIKPELFLKFKIRKKVEGNRPRVICPCGGRISDYLCDRCARKYRKIIDVVDGTGD